jgi:plexin A
VFVANVPCTVVEYEISVRIVCVTAAVLDTYSGPVKITLAPDREAVSADHFRFVDPQLRLLTPLRGPASGGTAVTIRGDHLDTSAQPRIWLGTIPCLRENGAIVKETEIKCWTSSSPVAPWTADQVIVQLDNANRTLRTAFEYTPDPTIESINPLVAIQSGGRQLRVYGTNFDTIAEPKIFLIDPIQLRERDNTIASTSTLPPLASDLAMCTVLNASTMLCQSPSLRSRTMQQRQRRAATVTYDVTFELAQYPRWPIGFVMDGVKSVQHLSDYMQMTVVPDPDIFPFTNGKRLYRGVDNEPIVFDGRNLALATSLREVNVTIGGQVCALTALTSNQLACVPPTQRPFTTDVVISIGNARYELGRLLYATSPSDVGEIERESQVAPTVFTPTILGSIILSCCLLLLAIVIGVAFWWRRKSSLAEKEYKRIQLQMDNLETNVRHECKQAFAELQTDMGDMAGDVLQQGIPYRPRRAHAARILFKDDQQQALLIDAASNVHMTNAYSNHLHVALAQFETLLWNRQFLCTLVDTWESQPTFCAQDRVYVASLLSTCLARNMQYYTDTVILLLQRLIEKSVRGKSPQLMLRRTESIVEKMLSNWIALCMYDHLQETDGAGRPLFLLYNAVKHQIQKGPVDAVTGDARYSLSEDRLLKEHVDDADPIVSQHV